MLVTGSCIVGRLTTILEMVSRFGQLRIPHWVKILCFFNFNPSASLVKGDRSKYGRTAVQYLQLKKKLQVFRCIDGLEKIEAT